MRVLDRFPFFSFLPGAVTPVRGECVFLVPGVCE